MDSLGYNNPIECPAAGQNQVSIQKHEWLILAGSVVLSLIIHGAFVLHGPGEPDAARIAMCAVLKADSINPAIDKTASLYQYYLVSALRLGMPPKHVPALMNYTNVILGSLSLIPMYLLWRSLSGPRSAALVCILFSFTPAFWLANTYGMPHLPAFFFLLCAMILFGQLWNTRLAGFIVYGILTTLMMICALACKIDVVLYSSAFAGILALKKNTRPLHIIASAAIPIVALGCILFCLKCLTPNPAAQLSPDFLSHWHQQWPTDVTALKCHNTYRAAGYVFFAGIAVSGLYCLWNKQMRPYALFAVLWAAPAFLFWALRWGNSVRHMMISYNGLMFMFSVVLVHRMKNRRWLYTAVPVLIAANYLLLPVQDSNINKGGRLIETQRRLQAFYDNLSASGREFIDRPFTNQVLVGSETIPYVQWEILTRCRLLNIERDLPTPYTSFNPAEGQWNTELVPAIQWVLQDDLGRLKNIRHFYIAVPVTIRSDETWHYWSCEKGVTIVGSPNPP